MKKTFKRTMIAVLLSGFAIPCGSFAADLIHAGSSIPSTDGSDATLSGGQSSPATVISSSGITSSDVAIQPDRGIIINSNPDATPGEYFQIVDGGETVMTAIDGTSTQLQSGTSTLTINFDGTVDIDGTGVNVTGGDLNMNNNNISGVADITASGVVSSGSVSTGALSTTGDVTVGGNQTVSGSSTITGNLSANGATNTIGVAAVSTNTINGATNTISGTTATIVTGADANMNLSSGLANLNVTGGGSISVYGTTQTLSTDASTLSTELNGVGTASSQSVIAGATYLNRIDGNTLVNGNLYVNGTLTYSSNSSATTSVSDGTSVLVTNGTTSESIIAVNNGESTTHAVVDSNGVITMSSGVATESSASVTLTNGLGNTHGLVVTESATTLSGGTHSTSMTLDDSGATFSTTSGGPSQVHGVADGTSTYDAVNLGQLRSTEDKLSGGIAMSSAFSGIPQVDTNKKFSLGTGYGYYNSQSALAVGGSVRVSDNAVIKTGVAISNGDASVNAGFGYSW